MKHIGFLLAIVLLLIPSATEAQRCLSLPPESPVSSSSPDDIPATNIDYINYNGTVFKGRANHNFIFMQMSPTDQRIWFAVEGPPPPDSDGIARVFYNRRVRDDIGGPWRWLYSYSPEIIRYSAGASSGPASVHYSDTPKYRDPATSHYYKYIMYENAQPGNCNGQVAGFVHVSFSNDGVCWTDSRVVHRPGGPTFPCFPGQTEIVPVEQFQAIDGGDRMWLVGVEGNIDELVPPPDATYRHWTAMDRTQTAMGWASYYDPTTIYLVEPIELTANGMFLPVTGPWNYSQMTRYAPYAYFINLAIGFDAQSGYFYIGRAYPYPYDRGSMTLAGTGISDPPTFYNVPTWEQDESCLPAPYTLPNRIQIYRMYIGSLFNISQLGTGTWEFIGDYGGFQGYGFKTGWSGPTYLVYNQNNIGHDFGAISFLRDRNGNLVRDSAGYVQVFGAHTLREVKSIGPCVTTGFEREVLFRVP